MPSQRELSQGIVCFFTLGNREGSEHPRAQYLAWKRVTILYLGHAENICLLKGRKSGTNYTKIGHACMFPL